MPAWQRQLAPGLMLKYNGKRDTGLRLQYLMLLKCADIYIAMEVCILL